jgi:hypothetical protein
MLINKTTAQELNNIRSRFEGDSYMTNEEAIAVLENEITCIKTTTCDRSRCKDCHLVLPESSVLKALDMAILSLKTEQKGVNYDGTRIN